jgi:hypothetical protein
MATTPTDNRRIKCEGLAGKVIEVKKKRLAGRLLSMENEASIVFTISDIEFTKVLQTQSLFP